MTDESSEWVPHLMAPPIKNTTTVKWLVVYMSGQVLTVLPGMAVPDYGPISQMRMT